jgi:hypothetical protein
MNGDPFEKVSPGERLRGIPAEVWNAILEVAREHVHRFGHFGAGWVRPGPENSITVKLRNMTGVNQPQFAVLGIGAPLLLPKNSFEPFAERRAYEGNSPVALGSFAITQDPIGMIAPAASGSGSPVGAIAPAVALGVTPCYLDVVDESHEYAGPTTSTTMLRTQCDVGPAKILWKEPLASGSASASASSSGSSGRRAVVLLTGGGGRACNASGSGSGDGSGSGSGDRPRVTVVTGVCLIGGASGSSSSSSTGSSVGVGLGGP